VEKADCAKGHVCTLPAGKNVSTAAAGVATPALLPVKLRSVGLVASDLTVTCSAGDAGDVEVAGERAAQRLGELHRHGAERQRLVAPDEQGSRRWSSARRPGG
jgi:hypothetical protein